MTDRLPEPLPRYRTGSQKLDDAIAEIIGAANISRDADLVFEMLVSILRMGRECADRGDLKLVNSALKELRYEFLVYGPYATIPKVSIFGSARIARDDPTYIVARDFGRAMAQRNWMIITGAGPGIMEAGIEGAGADRSFGVNIQLPFEQEASPLIVGDPKLINFRYFFTRKLTFMKESKAYALLPGGFGTLDETFELLTLMQTGRSPICPVVLLEPQGTTYWDTLCDFLTEELVDKRNLISAGDLTLLRRCETVEDAVDEICHFYSRFHSIRVVGRKHVIRMNTPIDDTELEALNDEFADIVTRGSIERTGASAGEIDDDDVVDLPRIAFMFNQVHFPRLRTMIDRLNGPLPKGR